MASEINQFIFLCVLLLYMSFLNLNSFSSSITSVIKPITDITGGSSNIIQLPLTSNNNPLITPILTPINSLSNGISNNINSASSTISNVTNTVGSITSSVGNLANGLTNVAGNLANGLGSSVSSLSDLIQYAPYFFIIIGGIYIYSSVKSK